jgi:predicted MFS family arabinose efflux permease
VTSAAPVRLAGAGIGIVGVTFGMARYGYGLLLPDIRREYGLGPGTLGAIGTAGYVAYLAAATATGAFAGRAGPRRTAVAAGVLAALGMALAGLTRSPTGLLAGVLTGGASAGLAFPPFSDAARDLPPRTRGRVIAAINCGTGYGVALAAPIAILAGAHWRATWLACAVVALAAAVWAARVLPAGALARQAQARRALRNRRAAPLLAGAVLVGLGSSAFWTFAVERLDEAGALSPAAGRAFLGVVGVASLLATLASDLVRRLGARRALRACAAAEAAGIALLAAGPRSLAVALLAAVLFGAAYNAVVAIQVLWSTQLFPARPSVGLAAAMTGNGLGLLAGPLAAGLLAGPLGLGGVLAAGAALVLAAGRFAPDGSRLLI